MKKSIIAMAISLSALASCSGKASDVVPVDEFEKLIQAPEALRLLDVRTPEEFEAGHIPGAVNVDWQGSGFLENVVKTFPDKGRLALYCRSGRRSAEAAALLDSNGFSTVDLEGGVIAWQKAGLPLTDGSFDLYLAPDGKQVSILPLIHASIRIVYDGKEIEVDPVASLGNRSTDYAAFPKADLILVTHEHHDHLDPGAIKTLSKADTVVIANPNSAGILGYGTVMKNGDRLTLADGIEVEAVPAYNVSPDRLQFHPRGRDNGYILSLGGLRIYIAGDTEVIPEMKTLGAVDIAFLPCNLPYTMTPDQLVEAAETIHPKVVYPYHFGTTDLSSITPLLAPQGIYVRIRDFDP